MAVSLLSVLNNVKQNPCPKSPTQNPTCWRPPLHPPLQPKKVDLHGSSNLSIIAPLRIWAMGLAAFFPGHVELGPPDRLTSSDALVTSSFLLLVVVAVAVAVVVVEVAGRTSSSLGESFGWPAVWMSTSRHLSNLMGSHLLSCLVFTGG